MPDGPKSIPKGSFVVMKTGTHAMRTRLRLFLDWGITFEEPYAVPERADRAVAYASRVDLEKNLPLSSRARTEDTDTDGYPVLPRSGVAHVPAAERRSKKASPYNTMKEGNVSYFGTIYADTELPSRARTVYMYPRDPSDAEGKCWPGIKTIASDMKLSHSTVKRALADLERAGYLDRTPRHRENGSSSSNLYFLR